MSLQLYELCGSEGRLFSPYCWRVRLALQYKGVDFESVPIRFTDKAKLTFSGQDRVPVLAHPDGCVVDSFVIAQWMEEKFGGPSLFPEPLGLGGAEKLQRWVDGEFIGALYRLILLDIYQHLDPEDQFYFRCDREGRWGKRLEERYENPVCASERLAPHYAVLRPYLAQGDYLSGDLPGYADFVLYGTLAWARAVSDRRFVAENDPVFAWWDKMDRRGFRGALRALR